MCSVDRRRWTADRVTVLSHEGSCRFLTEEGIPERSLLFTAAEPGDAAEWVQGARRYVVLGDYTEDEHFVLDAETGSVHFGTDATDPVWPVNSGIREFVRCLEVTEGEFPFYAAGATSEEKVRVASRLEVLLRDVDPESFEAEGAFWMSFIHDVSIGDFSTEDVDWWPPGTEDE